MSKQSKRARFYARERVYRQAVRTGTFRGFLPIRWARRRRPVTCPMEIGCVEGFRFIAHAPMPAPSGRWPGLERLARSLVAEEGLRLVGRGIGFKDMGDRIVIVAT